MNLTHLEGLIAEETALVRPKFAGSAEDFAKLLERAAAGHRASADALVAIGGAGLITLERRFQQLSDRVGRALSRAGS